MVSLNLQLRTGPALVQQGEAKPGKHFCRSLHEVEPAELPRVKPSLVASLVSNSSHPAAAVLDWMLKVLWAV